MTLGERHDPYTGFRFLVEIDGLLVGGFTEVTGIRSEVDIEEYREGGVNSYTHKFPKAVKYQNIVLKRGITDSDSLFKWHKEVVSGHFNRRNGSIILMDNLGNEKWRWNFYQGYPVKWEGPDLKADSNTIAVETVELVHMGLEKG